MVKFIYSKEDQALIDKWEELLHSYEVDLCGGVDSLINPAWPPVSEERKRSAFLNDPGRQMIIDKLNQVREHLIPEGIYIIKDK